MARVASRAHKRKPARKSARKRKKRGRKTLGLNGFIVIPAIGLIALGAGFLWLRDSSFVEVKTVKVSGLTGSDSKKLEGEIERAARGMTTLHIDNSALARIAGNHPTIKEIRADVSLPNKVTFKLVHHALVARVTTTAGTVAVTSEGELVDGVKGYRLPRIRVRKKVSGDGLTSRTARASLALLVAAPAAWRKQVKSVYDSPRGLVADMRNGPKIYFGEGTDPRRQWKAASRLLAEPIVRNAAYIDVSSPGRSAVGGAINGVEPAPIEGVQPGVATPVPVVPVAPGTDQQQSAPAGEPQESPPQIPEDGAIRPAPKDAQPPPTESQTPQPPVAESAPQSQAPASGGASAQP